MTQRYAKKHINKERRNTASERTHALTTVNLSTKFIVWCRGKSMGSFDTHKSANEFLRKCPMGSYIQYPMGAIRDHQIAKARKSEAINPPIDKLAWDRMRQRQIAREREEAKLAARAEIAPPEPELESAEDISSGVFNDGV
jgi:hypothetical protein